jgi:hypothetical protein
MEVNKMSKTESRNGEWYRNEQTSTFDAHLFARGDVEDAGGGDGMQSDQPVPSACNLTTSYGEFHEVEDVEAEEGLCEKCLDAARNGGGDGGE